MGKGQETAFRASSRTPSIQFCCELAGRELPTFPGASWGPKGNGRSMVLARNGVGQRGVPLGLLDTSVQLVWCAKMPDQGSMRGPKSSLCSLSKGTCFSKDASCPSLVGLTCHHCTARRVLESRSPQPGMCLPRNHGKKPLEWVPSTHLQQLEGETAYSDRLEQTNEFPDCSILLPGP